MPVLFKDNKHFLFIHVPKTGGTSLEVVFARSGFRAAYIDMGARGSLNHLRRCPPQHMHAEMLQLTLRVDRFSGIFMVVRNPYDRFRSEYCMAHPVECDLSAGAVEAWATQVFADYAGDRYTRDNHIRPQHEFWLPGATVYKFEQGVAAIVEDISSRYAIELTDDEVREYARNSRSGISSAEVELNQAVTSMINQLYREDFRQFDYEMIN